MTRLSSLHHPNELKATSPTAPLEEGTDRLAMPNTHRPLLALKAKRRHSQHINTIFDTTWPSEQASQGPSTDQEVTLPIEETDTKHGSTKTIEFAINIRHKWIPRFNVMWLE